jgi:hypothetical protein
MMRVRGPTSNRTAALSAFHVSEDIRDQAKMVPEDDSTLPYSLCKYLSFFENMVPKCTVRRTISKMGYRGWSPQFIAYK